MSERERVREAGQTIAATKPAWTSDSLQPAKTPLNVPAMGGHAALQRKASGQVASDLASVKAQERVRGPVGNGLRLQAKLTVGHAGDEYEQEADRVAEQLMRMREPAVQAKCACGGTCEKCRNGSMPLQRMEVRRFHGDDAGGQEAPAVVHDLLRSPGQPLDAGVRAYFEPRLGWDLGDVRVHSGERADEAARSVNAVAFTVGKDMVFGAGQYAPGTGAGRRLLGHELTHVLQQERSAGPTVQRQVVMVIRPGRTREQNGAQVVYALRAQIQSAARVYNVPPELLGVIVMHESQSLERSVLGDVGERAQAALLKKASIGITQMRVNTAKEVRQAHPELVSGTNSVVDDLLDQEKALHYAAALLNDIDVGLSAYLASAGVTISSAERVDLLALAYNIGWPNLRDRNLGDPQMGADIPARITKIRRSNYLMHTVRFIQLAKNALAGVPPPSQPFIPEPLGDHSRPSEA